MSAKDVQKPAKDVQKPSERDVAAIKLVMYCSFVAFVAGIFAGSLIAMPLAEKAAVASGVFISICVGIFVVAPRAGHIAKAKIMRTLSDPNPEESKMLTNLTLHVLTNASEIAQHDEAKKLYKPIVAACMETLDESIDKSMANMASQASKGVGAFADDDGNLLKEFAGQVVFPTVDGIMESAGASENFRKKVKFKMLRKMTGLQTDGGSLSPNQSGYVPSGGK